MCEIVSCMCARELVCRVAVRVLSSKLTFNASATRGGSVRRDDAAGVRVESRGRRAGRARRVRGRQHRQQDGQRAAAGARAARLGAAAARAEASLGPALLPATPRGARRGRPARHHIPQGSRYPQQTHAGEVPEAER